MAREPNLDRYSRQERFRPLGTDGQAKLGEATAVVCGCGATGTAIASILVRAGVGRVRIIDRDFLELNNLQRQWLYDESDLAENLPKAEAAGRKLRTINSEVLIEAEVSDLDASSVLRLCAGAGVILDGTDNFETRFLLNDYSVKMNVPWVYGGCIGAEGHCMTIVPGETACLRCLVTSVPAPGTTPTCETAGILASISTIVASYEAAEAIKILSGNTHLVNRDLLVIDIWYNSCKRLSLAGLVENGDCPVCNNRRFDWLEGGSGTHTTALCGRNAVQIVPPKPVALDWQSVERRLAELGRVKANQFLMRLELEECEITLFPDGRAIIKGTDDIAIARSLYARYVGG